MKEAVLQALDEAERKAIDNLARYKFQNFGYWAAWWVKLNRLSGANRQNPFRAVVHAAQGRQVPPSTDAAAPR